MHIISKYKICLDIYIYIYIYIYMKQIIGKLLFELSFVRYCRTGYGMDLDFSTCNSDNDKRVYIGDGPNKNKENNSDNRWVIRKIELVNSCIENKRH